MQVGGQGGRRSTTRRRKRADIHGIIEKLGKTYWE